LFHILFDFYDVGQIATSVLEDLNNGFKNVQNVFIVRIFGF